jgi:hypothetical protein
LNLSRISPILLVFNQKSCIFAAKEKKQDYENRNYRGNGQGAAPAPGGLQE